MYDKDILYAEVNLWKRILKIMVRLSHYMLKWGKDLELYEFS